MLTPQLRIDRTGITRAGSEFDCLPIERIERVNGALVSTRHISVACARLGAHDGARIFYGGLLLETVRRSLAA